MAEVVWEKHQEYPNTEEPFFHQWFMVKDDDGTRWICFQNGLLGCPSHPIMAVGQDAREFPWEYQRYARFKVPPGEKIPDAALEALTV